MAISERPAPQIVHRYEDPYKHASTLKAFINNERVGSMDYVRNYETGGWNIENVMVNDEAQGRGIGKALLSSFVDQVGSGQTVHAAIIHEATYQTLVERYTNGLMQGETRDVPDEDFPSLALVRGLRLCGIEVTKISVGSNLPHTGDIPFNVDFHGRTL